MNRALVLLLAAALVVVLGWLLLRGTSTPEPAPGHQPALREPAPTGRERKPRAA